jgi:hypothetical protein
MKSTIGKVLLFLYWLVNVLVAIMEKDLFNLIALFILPMIVIPFNLVLAIISGITNGNFMFLIDVFWIGLALYLIIKE